MNRRLLLASYALIGASMMATPAVARRPDPTPEPTPPDLPDEEEAQTHWRPMPQPVAERKDYREIGPVQAAQNRQARQRAGYKARR